MEKLLEVLIAIGDEVASLAVAKLILRHWPSHARASHVKRTIEESEPVPFAPRSIDKRKAYDSDLDMNNVLKRLNQTIELQFKEFSLNQMEKLTRLWGCDRTPECILFVAHDLGSCSPNSSKMAELMHEASVHLSKIVESVALEWPVDLGVNWGKGCSKDGETTEDCVQGSSDCPQRPKSSVHARILTEKSSFWIRFYWLSGLVSIWEGNRLRAHEEFSVPLSLLENNRNLNNIPGSVQLPHCKVNKELTTDNILHEMKLLGVQFLLKNDVAEMLEKEMYMECIALLAALLLSTKGVDVDVAPATDKYEGFTTSELSALDVLIKAREKVNPLNVEVYLKCQKCKLQLLMVVAGMEDFVASCDLSCEKTTQKVMSYGTESKDALSNNYFDSIAEQVKAISECASQVKNFIDQQRDLVMTVSLLIV